MNEQKLKEKTEKLEEVTADVWQDSTVLQVEMQRRQLKEGMDMVDSTLRLMCRDELTTSDALIYLKTIGEPDLGKLVGYMTQGSSRDEEEAFCEATRWSACLSGAAMEGQEWRYKRKPVPDLTPESFKAKANTDSSTDVRTYSVCEKDEFGMVRRPNGKMEERKVHDGSWGEYIRSRAFNRPKGPGLTPLAPSALCPVPSGRWVHSVPCSHRICAWPVAGYGRCADLIFQHMAEMYTEVEKYTDAKPAGGFPQLFWNRKTNREATPAEKMALFYHLVINTKVREQGQELPPPTKIHAENNADLLAGCWRI